MTAIPKRSRRTHLVDDALTLFEEHRITTLFVVDEESGGKRRSAFFISTIARPAMNAVILIPARYASTRYPGKPLVELEGPGRPKAADPAQCRSRSPGARGVRRLCETDDERISDACNHRHWRDHDLARMPQWHGTLCRGARVAS